MGGRYSALEIQILRGVPLKTKYSLLDIMHIIGTMNQANPVPPEVR